MSETRTARFVRGLVKFVFIGCYAAFMWASIHHVATFFNNFEQGDNIVGAYLLAGAIDITALVSTIGVMFFRKSMPTGIQVIMWVFIFGLAGYSFIINWEYAAHFQAPDLTLQPTGATIPVFDQAGNLHYVPEMRQDTTLLFLNPLMASGFTIFALVYSIVAEFFGTKPPTLEELRARQQYLEQTSALIESIQQLEKQRGKSLLQRTKEMVKDGKEIIKELRQPGDNPEENLMNAPGKFQESQRQAKDNSEENPMNAPGKFQESLEENIGNAPRQIPGKPEESVHFPQRKIRGKPEESLEESLEENMPSWLFSSDSTVSLFDVSKDMKIPLRTLRNRVIKKEIRATKNKDIVYRKSLLSWLEKEGYLEGKSEESQRQAKDNSEENPMNAPGKFQESQRQAKDNSEENLMNAPGKFQESQRDTVADLPALMGTLELESESEKPAHNNGMHPAHA